MKLIAIVAVMAVIGLLVRKAAAWAGKGAVENPQPWPSMWGGWDV